MNSVALCSAVLLLACVTLTSALTTNLGNTQIDHTIAPRDLENVPYWEAIDENVGDGPQHEVIFFEIGEQQDATREAYAEHVNDFLVFLNMSSLNFTELIDEAFDEIDQAWLAGVAEIKAQADADFPRLEQAVWAHAAGFADNLNATYEQLADYQDGLVEQLGPLLIAEANATRVAVCQHVEDILDEVGAGEIPMLADMLEQYAEMLNNAADGAEDALENLEAIEEEVQEAIDEFEEDLQKFDETLTDEVQEFSDNLSQEINKIREEVDARDRIIQAALDVLKSGAALNGVKAERTLKKLEDFYTSGTTTSDPRAHPPKTDDELYSVYDVENL